MMKCKIFKKNQMKQMNKIKFYKDQILIYNKKIKNQYSEIGN